ncbi:condensation domain-containing protein, partial [Streptomyces sp. SD31]|uniref:condensation domain-containing protein n=1 Tax=Streptomyces sp. SD31 TaxID=3452208 RepID=UPI003F8B5291
LRGRDVVVAGEEYAARERARGFELSVAPLLRFCAHVESDDAWRLTVSHCHAVTEGWTLNTFLMELLDVYGQLRDGGEVAPYAAPSVRYADYIAAELTSLASADDRAFWQDVVGTHTPLRLPAAWADTDGDNTDRYWVQAPFGDLEDGLQRLAERAGASLKSVLLAAHLKVLSTVTTEDAFHTGVVYHGRLEAPDAERVLGMHLNTLPFPATRPTGTWQELVQRVFAQETEIWAHRRYPLPAIQRDSGETQRLITTLFDHQNFHQVDTDVVDTASTQDAGGNEFALSAIAAAGNINLGSTTQIVSRADMRRLASMYRRVLEAMAADPGGDAGAVYLPEGEEERLLGEWGATVEVPVGRRVHEVFAEQAARTPDHTAVTCGDQHLTYAELDARANRIAHHLISLGAGPETLVGLSLERGIDLIPSLLGVLKSGAAYLPLDPANPDERLATILEDAAAPILVT